MKKIFVYQEMPSSDFYFFITSFMKKSMDLFGEALYDRFNGTHEPFLMDFYGNVAEHHLERYFRTVDQLSKIEKRIINECYGDILDVGCGTANYFPLFHTQ
jgi:hypothetical protein